MRIGGLKNKSCLPAGWQRLGVCAAVLIGLSLRLIRLGADSVWYDETVSLYLALQNIPAMLAHTAGDIHPPLYYLLLHGWVRVAGATEFAAAMLSLLWGLLIIPLTFQFARRSVDEWAGVLSAFLVALSPFNIWYSQEVRMYTLGAILGLGAAIGLWIAVGEGTQRWRGWAVYVIAAAAGLYTLYYFAFLIVTLNLWVLGIIVTSRGQQQGKTLAAWAGTQVATLALYLPWLPIFYRQATDPPVPPWRSPVALGHVFLESWTALNYGQSADPTRFWPWLVMAGLVAGLGFLALWRIRPAHALLVLGYWAIPLALIGLISVWIPLYHVRYLFTYSPAFYVLLAAGLAWLSRRAHVVGVLVLAGWCAGAGLSLWAYHTDPLYLPDDHRAAVRYLYDHWQPGDAVIVNAGYVYPALLYYADFPPVWRGRLTDYGAAFRREQEPDGLILLQTGSLGGSASLGWKNPASDFYAMSEEEAIAALERVFADYDRVWIYRCYDTVTDPTGTLRRWLEEHARKFDEPPPFDGQSYIRVQGYLPMSSRDLPPSVLPAVVSYGDALQLEGISVEKTALAGGKRLSLALWWRPLHDNLPILATTVRLLDGMGAIWAQRDEQPLGSAFRTADWPAGDLVRHPLSLDIPLGVPPGFYTLAVGVYDPTTGQLFGGREPAPVLSLSAAGDCVNELDRTPLAIFDGDIDLVEIGAIPRQVEAGRKVELILTWRARRPVDRDLRVFVQLLDRRGHLMAAQESPPLDGKFPLPRWKSCQTVRERRVLHVPAEVPAGTYDLIVGWYEPASGRRWPLSNGWPWLRRDYYVLSPLSVVTRPYWRALPEEPMHWLDVAAAPGITLAGYTLDASDARPGGALRVKLFWHKVDTIMRDYSVFCHLVQGADTVFAQADGVPANGTLPTSAWMAGEYVVDERVIPIGLDVPAGEYVLRAGLYVPEQGNAPEIVLTLGTVRLEP